ncbi:MAG: MlaD family protein [Thermodesulfobacteriota bacterium]|nr:MlaD family protein [Thermodesulfobacteriota bacterium]
MSRQTNYYKLGLFVIVGTILFAVVLVALGAGKFFERTFLMTTYVDESVNGLEVGSPVKIRGVKVGNVSKISFGSQRIEGRLCKYRYVIIECSLSEKFFHQVTEEEAEKRIQDEVKNGLRVRLSSLGLTGQLFVEMDYLDPKLNPPLKIEPKPTGFYIPSAPSTMSRIEAAFNKISQAMDSIGKTGIGEALEDIKNLAQTIGEVLKEAKVGNIGKDLSANLKETRDLFARLNKLLSTPKIQSILPDASDTMAGLRRIVESSGDDIISAAHNISQASAGLSSASKQISEYLQDPEFEKNVSDLAETMKNVNTASVKVNAAATQLNQVLGRLNGIVASQQINIQAILENLRLVLENIKELSDDAKRYPSGVLFGEPPSKAGVKE